MSMASLVVMDTIQQPLAALQTKSLVAPDVLIFVSTPRFVATRLSFRLIM
eukprot:SAG31_NODE_10737_length_1104_cov_1.091542_1_plen_50_part_00